MTPKQIAEARVRAYLARRAVSKAYDPEHIHGYDAGCSGNPEGISLTVSDLTALLDALEAARAEEARLRKALGKIGTLAPVEKPPEPYDENGWQVADTGERHAGMVLAKDMWTVADFARTTLAEIKGESHE